MAADAIDFAAPCEVFATAIDGASHVLCTIAPGTTGDPALRTCGRLLQKTAGGASVEMTLPELEPFDAAKQWPSFGDSATLLEVEGNLIAIRLTETA